MEKIDIIITLIFSIYSYIKFRRSVERSLCHGRYKISSSVRTQVRTTIIKKKKRKVKIALDRNITNHTVVNKKRIYFYHFQ